MEKQFVCERCGRPVQFVYWPNRPEAASIIHDGCDRPRVTMTCENPRRLGVVMGVTE